MARPRKLRDVEMAVVVAYVIQKHGQPTQTQIAEHLTKLGVAANDGVQLRNVLDNLNKRDIISDNQKPEADGTQVHYFSMKRVCYAGVPEMAHISELLPALLADDDSQAIKDAFDEKEREGATDAEKKPPREALYKDAHRYTAVFRTLDRLFGGRMINPSLKILLDASQYKAPSAAGNGHCDLYFDRDANGALMIHGAVVRGWFSTGLPRITPFGEALGRDHCSFIPIIINPEQGLQLTTLPVHDKKRGSGAPTTYETLMPGELLRVSLWAPTKNFMTPDQICAYLKFLGTNARRYLSPARGIESGRMELMVFVDHGHTWDDIMVKGKTDADMDAEVEAALNK